MAFQYTPYNPLPAAASVGELLQRSGDIEAQRAMQIGNAQARAADVSGQAYANAAQHIGQTVAQLPGQVATAQTQGLELQQRQMTVAKMKQVAEAWATPGGPDAILAKLPPDVRAQVQKELDEGAKMHAEAQTAHGKAVEATADAFGRSAASSRKSGYDPVITIGLVSDLKRQYASDPEALKQLSAYEQQLLANPDPTAIRPIMDRLIAASPAQRKLDAEEMTARARESSAAKPNEYDVALRAADGDQTSKNALNLVHPPRALTATDLALQAEGLTAPGAPQVQAVSSSSDASGQITPIANTGQKTPARPPASAEAAGRALDRVQKGGKSLQRMSMMLDGKPTELLLDPDPNATQRVYDLQGQPITNAASRVKPPPPASIQNANATAANLAGSPAFDASRPSGPSANKINPKTGLTPNAEYQGAIQWALDKSLPNMGLGQSPLAQGVKTAIQNKGAAIIAASGVDAPELRAEYKAHQATLSKLMPQATATANAAHAAADNLDLALEQSASVPRTGSKLVNHYVQWVQGNFTPAAGLSEFETYIYTAAREYAKVASGGALSAAGLTDSAAREATKLLNAAQAPETFEAVIAAMKRDMGNVVAEQTQGLSRVSATIGEFFSAVHGVPPVAVSPTAPSRVAPAPGRTPPVPGRGTSSAPAPAGRLRVVGPNGETGTVPAGTALPPGWKVQ